jgi:hypothetical protein
MTMITGGMPSLISMKNLPNKKSLRKKKLLVHKK